MAGQVDLQQLARLEDFASEKSGLKGETERSLSLTEINAFMAANYKRPKGQRRWIDRIVMKGEWPVLLMVMGKDGTNGRYLSLADVRLLLIEQQLPIRMRATGWTFVGIGCGLPKLLQSAMVMGVYPSTTGDDS